MKIVNAWYEGRWWLGLLYPFSLLFLFIVKLRRYGYLKGILKSYKLPKPVIVVGNITLGGTGKTPVVIALANFLKTQNLKPGIISRGYKGKKNHSATEVTKTSTSEDVGDEALLIYRHTQCPMVIGRKRVEAADLLLNLYQCDVIICDDGLQHYQLQRDVEIVLIDSERSFGNGWCLPAGPLREPVSRLIPVDLILSQGEHVLADHQFKLKAKQVISLMDETIVQELKQFAGKTVHAVAGIGNPSRFFASLTEASMQLIQHVYPDHYQYSAEDINFDSDEPVIMTEKDAVKCFDFADFRHWYLSVDLQLDDTFYQKILNKIELDY